MAQGFGQTAPAVVPSPSQKEPVGPNWGLLLGIAAIGVLAFFFMKPVTISPEVERKLRTG